MPLVDHRNISEILGVTGSTRQPNSFIGCHLNQDDPSVSNQVILAGAVGTLKWSPGSYDFGGWFDSGNPFFVTVPNNVTRIRVFFTVFHFGVFAATDTTFMFHTINDAVQFDNARISYSQTTGVLPLWSSMSGAVDVSPGDEIAVKVFPFLITPANMVVLALDFTSFAVEAVTVE